MKQSLFNRVHWATHASYERNLLGLHENRNVEGSFTCFTRFCTCKMCNYSEGHFDTQVCCVATVGDEKHLKSQEC